MTNRSPAAVLPAAADIVEAGGQLQYQGVGPLQRPDPSAQAIDPQGMLPIVAAPLAGKQRFDRGANPTDQIHPERAFNISSPAKRPGR
jgi:hypothetical protein